MNPDPTNPLEYLTRPYRPVGGGPEVSRFSVTVIDDAGGSRSRGFPDRAAADRWLADTVDSLYGSRMLAVASVFIEAGETPLDGSPALLRAVFDATAAARAVAPPRPGIEFLHGWAAFHLDPDLAGPPRPDPPDAADPAADYRIDADDAAVFEVLERAAALAPGDPLFAEARRAAADWRRR